MSLPVGRGAVAGVVATLGCAVALAQWARLRVAVHRSRRLVAHSRCVDGPPGRRSSAGPTAVDPAMVASSDTAASVLVIGDSTAVGVGVEDPRDTLVARLQRRLPAGCVIRRARVGARIVDAIRLCEAALARGERHALVVLMIGGNDLLRLPSRCEDDAARRLAALAGRFGDRAVWIGCANVGLSPLFLPPLSWWLRWRGRRTVGSWAEACADHGVRFLDFWLPPSRDPYARRPERYYAADLIHPSGASHALVFRRLTQAVPLRRRRPVSARSAANGG